MKTWQEGRGPQLRVSPRKARGAILSPQAAKEVYLQVPLSGVLQCHQVVQLPREMMHTRKMPTERGTEEGQEKEVPPSFPLKAVVPAQRVANPASAEEGSMA